MKSSHRTTEHAPPNAQPHPPPTVPQTAALPDSTNKGQSPLRHLYQVGTTRVYFAAGVLERLEVLRMEAVAVAAKLVQSQVRRLLVCKRYTAQRKGAVKIQCVVRGRVAQRRFQTARSAATKLQALVRRVMTKKGLEEARM